MRPEGSHAAGDEALERALLCGDEKSRSRSGTLNVALVKSKALKHTSLQDHLGHPIGKKLIGPDGDACEVWVQ
jgi:hypothetical protein